MHHCASMCRSISVFAFRDEIHPTDWNLFSGEPPNHGMSGAVSDLLCRSADIPTQKSQRSQKDMLNFHRFPKQCGSFGERRSVITLLANVEVQASDSTTDVLVHIEQLWPCSQGQWFRWRRSTRRQEAALWWCEIQTRQKPTNLTWEWGIPAYRILKTPGNFFQEYDVTCLTNWQMWIWGTIFGHSPHATSKLEGTEGSSSRQFDYKYPVVCGHSPTSVWPGQDINRFLTDFGPIPSCQFGPIPSCQLDEPSPAGRCPAQHPSRRQRRGSAPVPHAPEVYPEQLDYIQWISVVRFFLLDLSKWETWNLWRKTKKNKLYLFDRMPKSALLVPKWRLPQVYQGPSLILVCLPSPKLNVSGWHRRLPQSYVDQISSPNPSQNVAQINMLMPD